MARAGDIIRAVDLPPAVTDNDSTLITDISSSAWITGTPTVEVDFTAPTSGKVVVTVGGGCRGNAGSPSAPRVFMSFEITHNTGTTTYTRLPGVERSGYSNSSGHNNHQYGSRDVLVYDLEPGGSYTCTLKYKVSSGSTADIEHRSILVTPAQ